MPKRDDTLECAIKHHRHQIEYFTIVAKKPFTKSSIALKVDVDEEYNYPDSIHEAGYSYFLSKSDFEDIEKDIASIKISNDEFVDIAIHYAEHDAYPSWIADRY